MSFSISKYDLSKYWIIICLILVTFLFSCKKAAESRNRFFSGRHKDQPELVLQIEHMDDKLRENSGIILYRGYL